MKESDEIVIEAEFTKEKEQPILQTKEEQINSENEQISNKIKNIEINKIEIIQKENEEKIDSNNKKETENIEKNSDENNSIKNNNILINQPLSSDRKENGTEINIENNLTSPIDSRNNINDNISTIPTKEESVQQIQEQNNQNQNQNYNEQKHKSYQIIQQEKNIIDEMDEYKAIENILQPINNNNNNQRNNLLNNNNFYFTETNVIGQSKNDIHKSSSNKLYTISSIPEYPEVKKKNFKAETPMKKLASPKGKSTQKTKKSINSSLDNLSPEQYMKKRIVNKYNFHPLQYRIKKIEEDIQKQNDYDYQKVMKELQIQYDKKMKNKEKEKQILEEHEKLKEKLKNMEEYRNNLINLKLQKIKERQNKSNSKIKKNANKSQENNSMYNIKSSIDGNNNNNNSNTIEAYGYNSINKDKTRKLPLIQSMPKYEIIKMMKDKKEDEFCSFTEKRLKDNELIHRKNYLRQLNLINRKLRTQNRLYNQRSIKCLKATQVNEAELEEDYRERDMIRRYNIKQNLLRERSAKKEKIKENLMKNLEGVKEKKELLERQEDQKIKEYMKRLNRQMKKEPPSDYQSNQRNYFANLQKKNLDQNNKEINEYYNELILRQEENLMIINELQKNEPFLKQTIFKRTLQEQNKKNKKLQSLNKFLEKMDRKNINNQTDETKRKLFKEKRRIEIEKKKKEEEEEEFNKNI